MQQVPREFPRTRSLKMFIGSLRVAFEQAQLAPEKINECTLSPRLPQVLERLARMLRIFERQPALSDADARAEMIRSDLDDIGQHLECLSILVAIAMHLSEVDTALNRDLLDGSLGIGSKRHEVTTSAPIGDLIRLPGGQIEASRHFSCIGDAPLDL